MDQSYTPRMVTAQIATLDVISKEKNERFLRRHWQGNKRVIWSNYNCLLVWGKPICLGTTVGEFKGLP